MNNVNIGSNSGSVNVGGTVHGSMTGANITNPALSELTTLLDRLRAELPSEGRPEIEQDLTELAEAAGAGSAEVVRTRWDRIKAALGGVAQVSETLAKIGGSVHQLLGSF
jgi:hypothetical protein